MSTGRLGFFSFTQLPVTEEKSDWLDKNAFENGVSNLKPLHDNLHAYIKKYGSKAPSQYAGVNAALSWIPFSKTIGLATNQPYASAAFNIVKTAIENIGKTITDKPQIITAALEELLEIYNPASKEISGYINDVFWRFLKVKAADMPISKEVFLEKKKKIYAAFEIQDSLTSSYVMVSI